MDAKLRYYSSYRDGQGPIQSAAAGTLVPASAKLFGDGRDVELALAAQADAEAAIGQLAKKGSHFNIPDGQRVVHQPFAVFLFGARVVHLFPCHPYPGQRSLAVQVTEGRA